MSAPVLVCFAVPQEARPFRKLMRARADVQIIVTGMGARRAEGAARQALERSTPRIVYSCGFAGALDPGLVAGDVLFGSASTSPSLAHKLRQAGAKPTTFFCAVNVATTAAEKSALRTRTGADAVEMESGIISEVCRQRGIECVTVRAISDAAHENLPLDFNALMTPEFELSSARLAVAIIKAPHKIPALIRLGGKSASAAKQLARVLSAVV